MEIMLLIGRLLFGGFFLMMGFNHLKNPAGLIGYATSKNVPSPKAAVIISGIFLLLGGLGIILGIYPDIALILIAVFLLVVTPTMHAFWKMTDPNMRMADQINFTKNMALLGATLALYALSSSSGWPLSVL